MPANAITFRLPIRAEDLPRHCLGQGSHHRIRNRAGERQSHGVQGVNMSLSWVDPATMFRYFGWKSFSPHGFN